MLGDPFVTQKVVGYFLPYKTLSRELPPTCPLLDRN